MDLLEHQGKALLARGGIAVPEGLLAETPDEAGRAAASLGAPVVVKAQVPFGKRGKAGGIVAASGPEEASEAASRILGRSFEGHVAASVLVERAIEHDAELYLAVILDREAAAPKVILSGEGGVDVEELSATRPSALATAVIDPLWGLADFQVRGLLAGAGLSPQARHVTAPVIRALYGVLMGNDASLAEINPLAIAGPGAAVALDAKIVLDDSALGRHPELSALAGGFRRTEQEAAAANLGLSFVKLDGDVGVIGNGAGLVMATLDLVARSGGRPADFLDVGGGAGEEKVAHALELILMDGGIRSVLVNIFGGITRCDLVARGIAGALPAKPAGVPVIVRLDGTNAAEGREILAASGIGGLVSCETMEEAAALAASFSQAGGK